MSSKQCLNVVWFVVCFILAPFSLAHASGLEAGSWGGKVRAGPGKNYDQIGSLQNGDPVVLLKRFDVASSEYPWFELTFKGGQVGYQWGGILCAFESAVEGVYKQCEKDNRPLVPRLFACSEEAGLRSKNSKRETQIKFVANGPRNTDRFEIYWLDYDGQRKKYKTLTPGQSWTVKTYPSHPWLVLRVSNSGARSCFALVRGRKQSSELQVR